MTKKSFLACHIEINIIAALAFQCAIGQVADYDQEWWAIIFIPFLYLAKQPKKGKNDPTFNYVKNVPSKVYKLVLRAQRRWTTEHWDARKGTLTAVKHIPNFLGNKTLIMARQIHMSREGDGLMPSGLYHVRKRPDLAHARSSVEAFPQLDSWITYDKQYVAMEHIQGLNLKTEFGISASRTKQLQTSPYIFLMDLP